MGASKTFQYTNEQNKLARTAKAMGHSARIAIIEHLTQFGLVTNEQIMLITQLSGATVSRHLRELFIAGLITEIWLDRHYYILTKDAKEMVARLSGLIGDEAIAL